MNDEQKISPKDKYVVKYPLTDSLVREAMEYYWNKRSRVKQCVIGAAISIVLYFLTWHWFFLAFLAVFVVLAVLWVIKARRSVANGKKAVSMYYAEPPHVTAEVSDKIYYQNEKVNYDLGYEKFRGFYEANGNQIVLVDLTGKTISLPKTGFVEGSYEDCLAFLQTKMKKIM